MSLHLYVPGEGKKDGDDKKMLEKSSSCTRLGTTEAIFYFGFPLMGLKNRETTNVAIAPEKMSLHLIGMGELKKCKKTESYPKVDKNSGNLTGSGDSLPPIITFYSCYNDRN